MTTNFHELYQRYAQDVYRFATWLCDDPAEAEDITSETFVRALTAPGVLEAETVKGYLLTIARNLVFKRNKDRGRQTVLEADLVDQRSDPAGQTETALELESVFRHIHNLTEIDRTVFLLSVQEELSYEEIARVMHLSLAAVKVKIHRARLKLLAARQKQGEPS